MGQDSGISWTHHTANFWRGCTKVSAGCASCYAETLSHRNPSTLGIWGPSGTRAIAAESYWQQPLKWDRLAAHAGERHRVFCASLADVFEGDDTMPEDAVMPVRRARLRLFDTIRRTPNLDWLLLTKRPQNIMPLIERAALDCPEPGETCEMLNCWLRGKSPESVWLGCSVENQQCADERIPHLLKCPAKIRFLSCEPLLQNIDLSAWLKNVEDGQEILPTGTCDTGNTLEENHQRNSSLGETCLEDARTQKISYTRDMVVAESAFAKDGTNSPNSSKTWAENQTDRTQSSEETTTGITNRETVFGQHDRSKIQTNPTAEGLPPSEKQGRLANGSEELESTGERSAEGYLEGSRQSQHFRRADIIKLTGEISWLITGAESGPRRRPSDLAWHRSIRDQCAAAGVAYFCKQLEINGRVTDDPADFPEDLRIQEFANS